MLKGLTVLILLTAGILGLTYFAAPKKNQQSLQPKVYWFIPDGMRAEPGLFNIYKWAEEGKLPNIKKMIDGGSYGYARPNFPSHTPTNFATLLTGTYPDVHGVNDGPMRAIGKPLDKVAIGGFSSVAKKVPPIWTTLEQAGMTVALLSIPGSTPPELQKGFTFRGRWGGWGADFHALNFETKGNLNQRILQGRGARLFYFGPELTQYPETKPADGWASSLAEGSFSPPLEMAMTGWGKTVYGLIIDSTDDSATNYDQIIFSFDKKEKIAQMKQGGQSDWLPIQLQWKVKDSSLNVDTRFNITVIKLDKDGFFRVRFFYNNLNKYVASPAEAADKLLEKTGPMVDFADNFPPQLIFYPEDKGVFLKEAQASLEWHKSAVKPLIKDFNSQIILHDIYTPNQMLTSRWWLGYIDPNSKRYNDVSDEERQKLWEEVMGMYQGLDKIIGEIIDNADKNTYIVLSSDHGAVPLDRSVYLNNLFAKKGWLKFTTDKQTGEPIIDWKNTKAMYLKMAHVYINPNGLVGDYQRAQGDEYEKLRDQVISVLSELQDENGVKPVVEIVKWENAKDYMRLAPDRVGDLVIANRPGYGWNEEMTDDLKLFDTPLIAGYKQAIKSDDVQGMWTPFMIMGPGIKKNNFLGDKPFELIDEYPTIMKALKQNIPDFVRGKAMDVFN
ncbi:alkaline phosphatase family protein [Candidatus Collierbacteria bacterium]|nr:alkaline phosphatase family protein [Candidatus Collierbacteria bacterium]